MHITLSFGSVIIILTLFSSAIFKVLVLVQYFVILHCIFKNDHCWLGINNLPASCHF